ncbi:radical SAM protein [Rickettsia endosymbiont of Ceutorhynchus obstrictus]|uniref:radical SAM protein n=1 Tax=Rickettsia endosymbiont of Ceutorhynchus obstrictus TaxID=3066249 RepID=UPI00313311CD
MPDRQDKTYMSREILEHAIKKLFIDKTEGGIDFLYHAGEPMVVGKTFYENTLEIINKYKPKNLVVNNVIQTNGVLINENWAQFFIKNNFKVGISLDGPKSLHDANRKNWNNNGSFDKTLRGFKLLKEYGLTAGILTVITSLHLEYAKELIDFYIENGIEDVGFNIEEIENTNTSSSLGTLDNLNTDKYTVFMKEIFDLSMKYSDRIRIRELSDALNILYSRKKDSSYCAVSLEAQDLGILTIQKNGDITTYCPEFAGMKSKEYNNFIIGNVLALDKLSDIVINPNYIKIKSEYDKRKQNCKNSCEYYSICGSSYLSNVFSETKTLTATKNLACILQKQKLFDLVLEKLIEHS